MQTIQTAIHWAASCCGQLAPNDSCILQAPHPLHTILALLSSQMERPIRRPSSGPRQHLTKRGLPQGTQPLSRPAVPASVRASSGSSPGSHLRTHLQTKASCPLARSSRWPPGRPRGWVRMPLSALGRGQQQPHQPARGSCLKLKRTIAAPPRAGPARRSRSLAAGETRGLLPARPGGCGVPARCSRQVTPPAAPGPGPGRAKTGVEYAHRQRTPLLRRTYPFLDSQGLTWNVPSNPTEPL